MIFLEKVLGKEKVYTLFFFFRGKLSSSYVRWNICDYVGYGGTFVIMLTMDYGGTFVIILTTDYGGTFVPLHIFLAMTHTFFCHYTFFLE